MSNRVAGFVLAVLLVICAVIAWRIWVLTQGDLDTAGVSSPPGTAAPDASRAFIDAWSRNEASDYLLTARVGLIANGLTSFTDDIVAQRNGQRLINRDGTIIYRRDDETETCRQTVTELFCTPAESVPSFAERKAEVEALTAGDDWRYRVNPANRPGCFELKLDLSKGSIQPEFGLESTYCFDAATGALTERVVERVNRTETYRTAEISDDFTRADLSGQFPEPILDRFFG